MFEACVSRVLGRLEDRGYPRTLIDTIARNTISKLPEKNIKTQEGTDGFQQVTKYIDDKMAALEAKVDAQLEDMSGVIRGDRDQINQGF